MHAAFLFFAGQGRSSRWAASAAPAIDSSGRAGRNTNGRRRTAARPRLGPRDVSGRQIGEIGEIGATAVAELPRQRGRESAWLPSCGLAMRCSPSGSRCRARDALRDGAGLVTVLVSLDCACCAAEKRDRWSPACASHVTTPAASGPRGAAAVRPAQIELLRAWTGCPQHIRRPRAKTCEPPQESGLHPLSSWRAARDAPINTARTTPLRLRHAEAIHTPDERAAAIGPAFHNT